MLKAKSTAATNGDHVGVVRYGLQSLYFLLWVCLSYSLTCRLPAKSFLASQSFQQMSAYNEVIVEFV